MKGNGKIICNIMCFLLMCKCFLYCLFFVCIVRELSSNMFLGSLTTRAPCSVLYDFESKTTKKRGLYLELGHILSLKQLTTQYFFFNLY